ncbi:hypothetical protein [Pelagibacterium xiamenense]|uniref:hypothetical protein n=1 Tax=Pelagibacterium xiamenense TaxID=2901140 RepID=UPI001E3F050A|nr:hypothetical protein [Pelagibacterium xiamenense]MCD7060430.1 hypothetical protein [Pelagibacterium xiamenense]
MADYRELLRRAIDALPENTGANRRAVYEKARSALVAQLRAIEPPLPAREITQHRLSLEDCIREVEQEATDKLLGRYREEEEPQVEAPQQDAGAPIALEEDVQRQAAPEAPVEPVEPALEVEAYSGAEASATGEAAEPEEKDEMDEPPVLVDEPSEPEPEPEPEAELEPEPEPESEPVETEEEVAAVAEDVAAPAAEDEAVTDAEAVTEEPEPAAEPEAKPGPDTADVKTEPFVPEEPLAPSEPIAASAAPEPQLDNVVPIGQAPDERRAASIEDIIAQASAESEAASRRAADDETGTGDSLSGEAPDAVALHDDAPQAEKHFIASPHEGPDTSRAGLVDVHGVPIGRSASAAPLSAVGIGEAMSSVREVEIEANAPESVDPQSAIDRAIAALDREARGEVEPDGEDTVAGTGATERAVSFETQVDETTSATEDGQKSGGFGALTVFLVIAIVLLAGGGAGGYWAWREGYIDLDSIFAQSGGEAAGPSEVAQLEDTLEPVAEPDAEAEPEAPAEPDAESAAPDGPVNTTDTPEQPAADPAEAEASEPAFAETETPANGDSGPELAFEDRLPAEAEVPALDTPTVAPGEEPAVAAVDGPQSLLLEEQANGNTGAVPYSGSVVWSRGTDELGQPTIVATASIPARNLDVEVLLRRNADDTLPASHLMEVNFDVAETFIGGSIANLPGVLLKDEELVQGQPLTGASARIVGNSFLFALSSASDQDVANNVQLLRDRAWLDLAMVYGTGRRAILTMEKGEEGDAIFEEVMDAWAAEENAGSDGAEASAQ